MNSNGFYHLGAPATLGRPAAVDEQELQPLVVLSHKFCMWNCGKENAPIHDQASLLSMD
jgi:hypothetical protein